MTIIAQPQHYTVTEGDTLEPIQGTIYKGDGTPQDLTGATVVFKMKHQYTGTVKVASGTASIVGAPTAGVVKYEWEAEDVDTPGLYDGEFVVTIGGKTLTFPNRNKIFIIVESKLTS